MKRFVAAMAVILAACGCTDVGCASGVAVSLASLVDWAGTESFTVELCLVDHCESQTIDPERAEQLRSNNQGNVFFEFPNEADTGLVSVSVTTDSGFLQAESSDIDFNSDRPNGAFCEPVCYYASVEVEGGQLVNQ